MIGLIDKDTRELVAVVYSVEGYDLSQFDQIAVDVDPREYIWDIAAESLVPRPATTGERADEDLRGSQRWQAIKTATPSQIRNWIDANVQNLSDAREVLALLVLAVQSLMSKAR